MSGKAGSWIIQEGLTLTFISQQVIPAAHTAAMVLSYGNVLYWVSACICVRFGPYHLAESVDRGTNEDVCVV